MEILSQGRCLFREKIVTNWVTVISNREKMKKVRIPENELRRFLELNRSTEFIAHYYEVSSRTITRRIKDYGLKGIRARGRKPSRKGS